MSEKAVRESEWFNNTAIRRMIEAHVAGRENYSHQLWALLVFETWRENYL